MNALSDEYVLARRALLDVLDVLQAHRGSLVLVGAQAVYFHAPIGFGLAAYTTDADLAIDPALLATEPEIAVTLSDAQYTPGPNPGSWASPFGVAIDLMVPDALVTGRSRRSARLNGHQGHTARRTPGLEIALLDNQEQSIGSLDPSDSRQHLLRVAGPAALVVAKTVKIRERLEAGVTDRVLPKDAGDLVRLLRMCDATAIGETLRDVATTTPYASIVRAAISWAREDVQQRNSRLVALAIAEAQATEPDRQVETTVRTLVNHVADIALAP